MKYIVKSLSAGVKIFPDWEQLKLFGRTRLDWTSPYPGFRDKLESYIQNGHLLNEIHSRDRGYLNADGNTNVEITFETLEGAQDYQNFLSTNPNVMSVEIVPIDS